MFKKKSALGQIKSYKNKMEKKAVKMTKSFIKDNVSRKSKMYRAIVKWPRRIEIISSIVFVVAVCYLFYKKAQDPNFLSDFKFTQL